MYRSFKIESRISSLRQVENAIDEATQELGISQVSYGKILVSALEAVNNAIMHGNNNNPDKSVSIEMEYLHEVLRIQIDDEGEGFIPENVPDPTRPENIEECNGRGVYLMKHLADELVYNQFGNSVTMTFKNIRD